MSKKSPAVEVAPQPTSNVLKLSRPIDDGGQVWNEISIVEPELGHYMNAERETTSEVQEALRLFSELTGVPEAAMAKLKTSDARRLRNLVDSKDKGNPVNARVDGDRHTITLDVPIAVDGQPPITAITLREPDLAAGIAIEKISKSRAKQAAMIAALSGLTIPITRRLKMRDVTRIEEWLGPFVADTSLTEGDGGTLS